MTQISPETAFELIRRLVASAEEHQADIMVTVCPMCQMNLDAYQGETNRYFGTKFAMPIVFFTQLVGLAMGYPADSLGFGTELVSTKKALSRIGVEIPETAEAKRGKKDESLPMPPRLMKNIKGKPKRLVEEEEANHE